MCCAIQRITLNWSTFLDCLKTDDTIDDKFCDYLIRSLYGRLSNIKIDYTHLYDLYKAVGALLDSKCFKKVKPEEKYIKYVKTHDMKILKNKKDLYDFSEYYKDIKTALKKNDNKKNPKYCEYIQYMFDLFKYMKNNNSTKVYNTEIEQFETIFKKKDNELSLLKPFCTEKELKLDLTPENKNTHILTRNKSIDYENGNPELCVNIETSVDNIPERKHKYETVLKDLPAYQIYEKLNNTVDKDKYCIDCKKLKELESNYPGIYQFCKKLARNLRTNLSDIKSLEKNLNDRCLYLIYWTYEEIKNIYKGNKKRIYEIPFFHEIFKVAHDINYQLTGNDILDKSEDIHNKFKEKFKSTRDKLKSKHANKPYESYIDELNNESKERFYNNYEFTNYKPCFYYFDCNLDECGEMRDLFDYFKNYDSIKSKDSTTGNDDQIYCEYISHINTLYGKYIEQCCSCYHNSNECTDECPHYFKCDQKYNPDKLYSKLKCKDERLSKNFKKVELPAPIDQYVKYITDKKYEERAVSRTDASKLTTLENERNSTSAPSISVDTDRVEEYDPFYTIVLGVLTLLGMSMIFFIFCKFTPLGNCFNSSKKTNRRHDAYEVYDQRLLNPELQNPNVNMENRRIQIAYQSAR
ncbi:variable surface protein Vir22/24 [Plasmodium vivax Mauritania I]|uniref:Variable surface protein Vir22/24 n=1 Tax=Plasmodium vivax Mauritania I TaxID=1035515 RepID=A0A0J9TI30_PLAVI|nr:variable surface protein Vir22/24 [Plasmodium vivax Mauritania I]